MSKQNGHAWFSQRIRASIMASGKSQKEIADRLGYTHQNMITMIKQGHTRLPQEKVVLLAQALGEPPALLLRDWLQTYMPRVLSDIEAYL